MNRFGPAALVPSGFPSTMEDTNMSTMSLNEIQRHNRLPATPRVDVASATGPLDVLHNQRVLVLADVENLRYSARDLGARLSYRRLGDRLCLSADSCCLHAFFSRSPGDDKPVQYFFERGWIPHPRDIETVRTFRGKERLANSDNLLLFYAGVLVSRSSADVVVLASGDGSLVCDLTRCLRNLPRPRGIATLSVAGSTSWRLNATQNPDIMANIEIGRDCFRGLS
jgi:hypothetical protein